MISQETIQQILSRIDIVEMIGGFVKLKKRGVNYLGLCPFHNEKTPSFTVSPSKEIYKCFGCGRSGNAIGFLMEHEKYSYVEALRWLANKYNVTIEETETSPEYKQVQQTAESLYIINHFAQEFFTARLFESEEGQNVGLGYLSERGFREEIIRKFQLGYNPEERDAFARAAIAAQYNPELLQKSGLVVIRDNKPMDNYRGRIIFPVHNQSGRVIGFGARLIRNNDRAPKYINTPENEIYVKSKILYGSWLARHAIDKQDECLLVEGYTDVISLHQAGIENVVASGGTSLTPDQLRLVKKYTSNLTIIYDGDEAGIKAALRGLDLALEEGLHVKLVLLPENEDPDSFVNKAGAAAFREFIASHKKDIILFQLDVALKEAGDDSIRKANVVNHIAESISRINKAEDFTRQQDYIHRCAQVLKIDESGLTSLVNKYIRERVARDEKKSLWDEKSIPLLPENEEGADTISLNLLNRDEQHERNAIRALLEFGLKPWDEQRTVAQYFFDEMDINGLSDLLDNKELLGFVHSYREYYENGLDPSPRSFLYHEDQQLSQIAISLMETPQELSPNWKEFYDGPLLSREDLYREEVFSTLNYLKLRKIKKLIEENQKDLQQPRSTADQLNLLQTHEHLKRLEMELTRQMGTVILK